VMAILLVLLEPITDKGLLHRMIAIMATTGVLTGLLVILCTLLLADGPLVRSSGAKNAVKQEGTTNADSVVQIDQTSCPGPSASGPSDEDGQVESDDIPVMQSDSLILRAAEAMPVVAALLVAFVIVYSSVRKGTPLSRRVASILAAGFSLFLTTTLVRLVGYSSEMHRPPAWVGAVQDTLDFFLLPWVACMFAMFFAFVLVLLGQALSPEKQGQDGQAGGPPANGEGTTRQDQHVCLGGTQAVREI
jgi:hypothetical protein